MSRRRFRTPGGQPRSGTGRYCQGAITGLRMVGPGGVFRPRHHAQPAEEADAPEKEEQDEDVTR